MWLIDWFIPRGERGPDAIRRGRLLVVACLGVVSFSVPLMAVGYLDTRGGLASTTAFGLGSVLVLLNPLILRYTGSSKVAGVLLCLELLVALGAMAFDAGGVDSASLLWTVAVPLLAAFLVGSRFAVLCAALAVAETVGLYHLTVSGYAFERPLSGDDVRWWQATAIVTVTAFVASMGALFERERHRSEERIREMSSQLMLADRLASVGTLAAGAAHEIRNPIAYVLGNLDYVIERVQAGGDVEATRAELLEALREAREGAQRVRIAIRDVRTFVARDDDQISAIDLNRTLESAIRLAWPEIRGRAALVRSLGEVPRVDGLEARLGQVFLNLLVNAAQAIEPGHAEDNEIRVESRTDGRRRAVIEITDTGVGIEPGSIGQLFDAHYTTKKGSGTGLGLAICRTIVKELGGAIEVESEPGRGTMFRVVLPPSRISVVPPNAERLSVAPVSEQVARILVIDDEPGILRAIARVLRMHEVTTVASGEEGVALCEEGSFDLILCDAHMPGMDGDEVLQRLMALDRAWAERVVFVTGGLLSEPFTAHADRLGIPILEKPVDTLRLRELVRGRLAFERLQPD